MSSGRSKVVLEAETRRITDDNIVYGMWWITLQDTAQRNEKEVELYRDGCQELIRKLLQSARGNSRDPLVGRGLVGVAAMAEGSNILHEWSTMQKFCVDQNEIGLCPGDKRLEYVRPLLIDFRANEYSQLTVDYKKFEQRLRDCKNMLVDGDLWYMFRQEKDRAKPICSAGLLYHKIYSVLRQYGGAMDARVAEMRDTSVCLVGFASLVTGISTDQRLVIFRPDLLEPETRDALSNLVAEVFPETGHFDFVIATAGHEYWKSQH